MRTSFRIVILFALVMMPRALGFGPRPDESPFFRAIASGDTRRAKALAVGKTLFDRDGFGRSGLILAAEKKQLGLVDFFLAKKLDVESRDMMGNTALHYAAANGDVKVVESLLKAKAPLRVYNKRCHSPADMAAGAGKFDVFARLRSLTAKATPPKDGTEEECANSKAPPPESAAVAQTAYFRRDLTINEVEDLGTAYEALLVLAKQPAAARAAIPEIAALVGHASPDGVEQYPAADRDVRRAAVDTLLVLKLADSDAKKVNVSLLPLVAKGGCTVFLKKSCREDDIAACKDELGKRLDGHARAPSWPRSASEERCYDCLHCKNTKVANSFDAAIGWFATRKADGKAALQALDSLKGKKLLPAREYGRHRKRLTGAR